MTERINVEEFQDQPLVELVMPDRWWRFWGKTVWRLRQPREQDYFRLAQVTLAFERRKAEYLVRQAAAGKALGERAAHMAEELTGEHPDVDPDPEVRAFMARETATISGPDPLNVTPRYKLAEILAVFIDPPQKPEKILALGPDIMAYLDQKLAEVFSGDAAKKRIAEADGSSPEKTSTASTPS